MKKKILLIILLSVIILSGCTKKTKKEENRIVENNEILSYTIDGEKTDIKPTKEEGYIVNKIICDNGSDIMWDNDNWEVELTKINSKDRCKVDFTKDTSKEGYRVTVTSNMTSALDSLSKATTENGTVKIYSTSKIENVTGCNGVIEDNKVIISNITSNQTCNIEIEDKTLASVIKKAYPPQEGRTDFSVIDNGTPNLYNGGDDGTGTTYYFSGDGTNMKNWVSFAGSLWRIIRINGNGSVRLLYAGTGSKDGYLTDVGESSFNSGNQPQYVGWRYTGGDSLSTNRGNETKSVAYTIVETWYNSLSNEEKNYIDTNAIYCNDRDLTLENGSSYNSTSIFNYYPRERLDTNKPRPTFSCSDANDKFPRKNNNAELIDMPVGLMTADEISFAGGVYLKSSPKAYYYLNASNESSTGEKWWWTMSPHGQITHNAMVFTVNVDSAGALRGTSLFNKGVIRPVISLKPEVLITKGDGWANSPYEITLP